MAEQKDAFVKDEDGDDTNTERNSRLADALKTIHLRKTIIEIIREERQWHIIYE